MAPFDTTAILMDGLKEPGFDIVAECLGSEFQQVCSIPSFILYIASY